MIRDAALLLAYRIKFSEDAKTKENKKMGIELNITKILGPNWVFMKDLLIKPEEERELDAFKERELQL